MVTIADQPPIGLKLRFARATQSDATFLTFKVSPAADQARRQVSQLRKLHLQLALETAGTLRKNIQNQAAAIQHPAIQAAFQVSFLAGTECRT